MYNSFTEVGTLLPGELLATFEPKFPVKEKRGGVMFVHGAGSNALYCTESYGDQNGRLKAVVGDGFTATSADNGGPQTWGNQKSINALSKAYGHTISRRGVSGSKVALFGDSMGGAVALNWAARNPEKVACFIGTIPVISIHDVHLNNRSGYRSLVDAAFDGWSADDRQGYDLGMPGGMRDRLKGIPMLIFYGATDQTCVPEVTEAFGAFLGSNVELVKMSLGHEEAAYRTPDRKRIVSFLRQHNITN